jgi:membrane protease YdiL (CAAX protease family)
VTGTRSTRWAAWVVTGLVSAAPAIVAGRLTGTVPGWLLPVQLAVLVALLPAGGRWPALRPLRRFAVAMAAMLTLLVVVPRWGLQWPALQNLVGGNAFAARMQAEQTAKLLVAAAMVGVLLLLGLRRRDFFLAVGDVRAPIRPVPRLGFPRSDPWWKFGLVWSVGIATGLAVALYLADPPATGIGSVAGMLPSILFYAALNAFTEEMTYRAPMLATLEPAVGSTQALWLSAAFFGIAHYFGTPGGAVGAALSVFMGWILGKSMIETRGLFWAWWIHFLSDVVIFTFLGAALVG